MMRTRALRAHADVVIGRQRAPKHETGLHMTPYLRAANVKDGVLDLADVKEMNFDPRERGVFSLRPGDVLITEGSGSLSSVGASAVWRGEIDGEVCFQNTLLRVRPRATTDARFLAWWCRHAFADGLFASVATGANIFHLSAERVRSLRMVDCTLQEQRAIADYLDAEVARIEELIDTKQRILVLLDERVDRLIGERVAASDLVVGGVEGSSLPLGRQLTKLRRPVMADAAVVTAFRDGQVTARNLRRTEGFTDAWTESGVQQGVRGGDVVVHGLDGFAGAIGCAEVDGACSPIYHVCQPVAGDPDYFAKLLRLLAVSGYLALFASSTRERAVDFRNWDRFRQIPIPNTPLDEQQRIGDLIRSIRPLRAVTESEVALLRERRQSLISAAVTGEMEVT